MKFIHLIWSNLKRKKLRTLLTLMSILIAFVLYCFLSAIEKAFTAGVSVAGADRIVVRHKVSLIQPLPESYKARILQIPGVAAVVHQTWFGGTYRDERTFFMQAPVEPEEFLAMFPDRLLSEKEKNAWLSTRTGAIAGRKTADRFHWKIGDRIPIQSPFWTQADGSKTWTFDLVGIYDGEKKETDTMSLLFRYDYFEEARSIGKGQVGWYTVKVKDPAHAAEVAQKIDDEFANSPAETKAESEGAFVGAFAKQIGDIGKIMLAILIAVFFTILLVAGNTMAQSVRERIEELGVLKALGFTNAQVMVLVLVESCFLSGLGGFLGLGLGWLMTAGGDPTNGMLPMFYFPVQRLVIGVFLVLALGVVTGIFPALQAMRLTIAEALRRM